MTLTWLRGGDPALAASDDLGAARSMVAAARVSGGAEVHREQILAFIDAHDDALHRTNELGHLTASGVVFDSAGERVILLLHRKLRRWLQPGGHCDGDANLAAVAWREATEETGIEGLVVHPEPIDLDVHEVAPPDAIPHLHLDARFVLVAPEGAEPPGNHESTDIAWFPVDDVDDPADPGLARMVRAARARWVGGPASP